MNTLTANTTMTNEQNSWVATLNRLVKFELHITKACEALSWVDRQGKQPSLPKKAERLQTVARDLVGKHYMLGLQLFAYYDVSELQVRFCETYGFPERFVDGSYKG